MASVPRAVTDAGADGLASADGLTGADGGTDGLIGSDDIGFPIVWALHGIGRVRLISKLPSPLRQRPVVRDHPKN